MAVKVVGKRVGAFTDKKTGELVKFGKVFVTYADEKMEGLEGICAEAISMRPELVENVPVGKEITIIYNRYGKADDFTEKTA